jgi:hypothetical protein
MYLGGAKVSSNSRTKRGKLEKGVRVGSKMRGDSIATYTNSSNSRIVSLVASRLIT